MKDISGNVIYCKSFEFAIRIVDLYKFLTQEKKEFVLSNQILRSGTSIGANISESTRAQSKKDFVSKLYIAFKEAAETEYWLKLLMATNYVDVKMGKLLLEDLNEIIRIVSSSIKTVKENLQYSEE